MDKATTLIIQSEGSQKEKSKYYMITHKCGIYKDSTDEPMCRTAMEMQSQRIDLWTPQGKERVGQTQRVAPKHIKNHV